MTKLTPTAKAKVDALLQRHPDFPMGARRLARKPGQGCFHLNYAAPKEARRAEEKKDHLKTPENIG